MKSIWSTILPPAVLATEPEREFALTHTVPPDPRDADDEVATTAWPLPAAGEWRPRKPPLHHRVVEALE